MSCPSIPFTLAAPGPRRSRLPLVAVGAVLVLALAVQLPAWAASSGAGVQLMEEYAAPGLEAELSGIYPHPTLEHLYYVVANKQPAYKQGQQPMLPEKYRGDLLLVDGRSGEVRESFDLVEGEYGDLAYGGGHLYVSSLEPPEILKVDLESGDIVARIPIAGPAGGMEYDAERNLLVAQIYLNHPHLAVIDPDSGKTVDTLWSDESAMGLAKVGQDLLCSWASSFDADAYSELRLIDQETGEVRGRLPLDGIHTAMAPFASGETRGFLSLVALDRNSGRVAIHKYSYDPSAVTW